jgi:hypothetical protein
MYGKPSMTCFKHQVVTELAYPPLQAALPALYGIITFTHLEENSRMVKYHTYVKNQREKLLVVENHM